MSKTSRQARAAKELELLADRLKSGEAKRFADAVELVKCLPHDTRLDLMTAVLAQFCLTNPAEAQAIVERGENGAALWAMNMVGE